MFMILQAGLPVANVLYSFRQSDAQGKIIVLILLAGSILAWSVMITKMIQLRRVRMDSFRFLAAYRNENDPVGLFLKRQKSFQSPLFAIYEETCNALGAALESTGMKQDDLFMGGVGNSAKRLNSRQIDGLRDAAEGVMADQALALEENMVFLATAVSSAPLLGLLGTVWGVMDAFGGMTKMGSALLTAVAPGIAGALLTTVVGLLVAIPSTIGYNMISSRIRRLCVDMENFLQELLSDLERNYLAGNGNGQ